MVEINKNSDSIPEISIIVPIFNTEKYLSKCLDSILGQTFSSFEVICIDDGSTDGCASILSDYAQRDSRINVVSKSNSGLSEARNSGLNIASGKYITFVDSDDSIDLRTLEMTHALAEKYNADLVSFSYIRQYHGDEYITQNDNLCKIRYKITKDPLSFCNKKGKWSIPFTAWGKLFRSTVLQNRRFIPNIYFEDYPYIVSLLKDRPFTVILQSKLYNYTYNSESITQTNISDRKIRDYHVGLNYIYDNCSHAKEFKFICRKIFPDILKQQLNLILRSKEADKQLLWNSFRDELIDLNRKKCIKFIGNKLGRYIVYMKIIKK